MVLQLRRVWPEDPNLGEAEQGDLCATATKEMGEDVVSSFPRRLVPNL